MSHEYCSRYGLPGHVVQHLYSSWKARKLKGQGWADFDSFVKWTSESGYTEGAMLKKHNENEVHGPENSYWFVKEEKEKETRKPDVPTEHPCLKCPNGDVCYLVCNARKMWWDVQMEKLKKELCKDGS